MNYFDVCQWVSLHISSSSLIFFFKYCMHFASPLFPKRTYYHVISTQINMCSTQTTRVKMRFINSLFSTASCLAFQETIKRENAVRQRRSSPLQLQWKQRRKDLSWLFSTRSGETAADVKNETDSRQHQRGEMEHSLSPVCAGRSRRRARADHSCISGFPGSSKSVEFLCRSCRQ